MKKAKNEGRLNGNGSGVFPASSTPKKMAAEKSREKYLKSRGESQSMLGRNASSAESAPSKFSRVFFLLAWV